MVQINKNNFNSDRAPVWVAAALLCLVLSTAFSACAFRKEKGAGDEDGIELLPFAERASLSYSRVSKEVLGVCADCHGTDGGVTLETYPQVLTHLADIERTALRVKSMPKNKPLTGRQMSVLKTWIKMGAPQFAAGETPTDPVDGPIEEPHEPIEPTYAAIRQRILTDRGCFDCHGEFGSAEELPLEPRSALLKFVDNEDPLKTTLMISTLRTGAGNIRPMPPNRDPYKPLQKWETDALLEWIRLGTPE